MNYIYKCKQPCAGKWSRVSGILTQVDATSDIVIGRNAAGNVYYKPIDGSGSWRRMSIPVPFRHISVTPRYMWATTATHEIYFRVRGAGQVFRKVSGRLVQVDAGATHVCGVNSSQYIYCKAVNNSGGWRRIGTGRLAQVTVGKSYVTGRSTSGAIYQCRLPCSDGRWSRVSGTLTYLDRRHA